MTAIRFVPAALVFVLATAPAPCAAQQWTPGGVPLCQSGCFGDNPRVVSDGAGGAYVGWRDIRNSDDVFLQRITASGLVAVGWPANGLPVVVLPSVQEFSGLAADGLGGALVSWEDWRNMPPATNRDPYVQRALSNGSLPPGWALSGNPASSAPRAQYAPQVAPDGSGGAFVAWDDDRDYFTNDNDIYAQHLTASGTVATGWPIGGLALCALPGVQGLGFVMPDDSAGAVFVWGDGRPAAPGSYAQRVQADGTLASGWPANGILLTGRGVEAAVRDEAGGFYVASPTLGPTTGFDGSYYLLRFRFDGTPAPGWPAGGVLVCSAPGDRAGITLDADGTGGVLLSWYDYRPPYNLTGGEIFATRVQADGTLSPGWAANGTLVSDPTDAMQAYSPFVARDGQGGAYIAWQSQGDSESPSLIQHLSQTGHAAAGWPAYGLRVGSHGGEFDTRVLADGLGGAIVAWDERCCGRNGLWAQRYGADGPTPVLVSLVNVVAEPDRVALVWQLAGGSTPATNVYRRTSASPWDALGSAIVVGADRVHFEDRGVVPGGRYAYRLGWADGGSEQFSAETWVDVPHQLELTLDGFRPNPAIGSPSVAFTLPDASPATLEAYDIAGRQLVAREVGSLGPGRHQVRIESAGFGPGVYHLRLRHAGATVMARGLIVR